MSDISDRKLPRLFWVVAIIALAWNAMGVAAYLMQVTISNEAIAALPAEQQALYAAQPAWVTAAFAIAVFAGMAGRVALVLRKRVATTMFVVSLLAAVGQMFYAFAMSNMLDVMGADSAVMPVAIIVIAGALVWFALRARDEGWTN